MIFQFVHMDFGASNLLNILKYSALNLRSAINKDGGNHQIWLHYVRSLGRNPTYDITSIKMGRVFDKVEIDNFQQDQRQVTQTPGWYQKCHLPYLAQALQSDEPMCYLQHSVNFHHVPKIDTDGIYFWQNDNKWYDIPWGFLNRGDAELFVDYCQSNNLLSDADIMSYPMYNANLLYIPQQHIQEVKDKYEPMMEWILNYYADQFNSLYCACSIAGQLCLSLIVRDMLGPDQDIHRAEDEFGFPMCSRFSCEAEQDISGSLRLFF